MPSSMPIRRGIVERLRQIAVVEKWLVLGGSWGSTLALYTRRPIPSEFRLHGIKGAIVHGRYDMPCPDVTRISYTRLGLKRTFI